MKRIAAVLLLTVFVCCATSAVGADTHPFSIHDMLAMERIGDPQVAPVPEPRSLALLTTSLYMIDFYKRRTGLTMQR